MSKPGNTESPIHGYKTAGLFRRLFAASYDGFLVIALLLLSTGLVTLLNGGEAITSGHPLYPTLVVSLVLIIYGYYAWFWIHGGQTLGMKTWRIMLVSTDEQPMNWPRSAIRLLLALISWAAAGVGFLWALFDSRNRCWHDLASKTELLDLRDK